MIKKNQRALNVINGVTDTLLSFAALLLAYWVRFYVFNTDAFHQPIANYMGIAVWNAALCTGLYIAFGLYKAKRRSGFARDTWTIAQVNIISVLVLSLYLFLYRKVDFSRWMLVYYFIISTVLVTSKHITVRMLLVRMRKNGRNLRHVLLVGAGVLAQNYVQEIRNNSYLGYYVDGIITCRQEDTCPFERPVVFGALDKLPAVLTDGDFDEVVIALDECDVEYTQSAIDACNTHGFRFSIIPYFAKYLFTATSPEVQTIGNVQVFDICASPLDSMMNRFLKRGLDLVSSLLIAIITSPIMLIAVLGVKLTSKGPVLFKQERVGKRSQPFNMYKFRSMCVNNDQHTAWSQKGDARVTAWGKFMRKTSIDELPQVFNIIKGDMSLVGPRPEIPFHVDHFKTEIPYYMARHQIRPGLTGWAQVNGYRGDTSIEKRIQHDLYYIYNWSLVLDIRIIFKTIFGGIISNAE